MATNTLIKDSETTELPGSPYVPAVSGSPATPAHCAGETITTEECVYSPAADKLGDPSILGEDGKIDGDEEGGGGAPDPGECSRAPVFLYDAAGSGEELDPSSSVILKVTGGIEEYIFSVSGTGFWFNSSHNSTEETSFTGEATLYTDGSACGTAEITVTDACGQIVTGYVRSTVGQWVLKYSTFSSTHTDDSAIITNYEIPGSLTATSHEYVNGDCKTTQTSQYNHLGTCDGDEGTCNHDVRCYCDGCSGSPSEYWGDPPALATDGTSPCADLCLIAINEGNGYCSELRAIKINAYKWEC